MYLIALPRSASQRVVRGTRQRHGIPVANEYTTKQNGEDLLAIAAYVFSRASRHAAVYCVER